jgi:dolichol-phosphate mannosyltransferase
MIGISRQDPHVVIVDLRRNYGYQGSITAGLFTASKDMIVSVDADLQDPPEKIEDMILKYRDGYEMVLGVREDRKKDFFMKRWTAALYYRFLGMIGVESVPHHGDFRLLSRALVEELKKFPERNRYLRGMVLHLESKYAVVPYTRMKRKAGKTKFDIKNLFEFAIDGITSLTNAPLRFIVSCGLLIFAVSLLGILYVFYIKFFTDRNVPGWAFIALAIMFFGGLQSLFLGILGEYIAKNYLEAKQRPLFLIRKVYTSGR